MRWWCCYPARRKISYRSARKSRWGFNCGQRKAIANGRFTLWVAVWQDVRGFEQLRVLQVADGTAPLIRLEHALPEALLMQSSLDHGGDIAASRIDRGRIVKLKGRRRHDHVIDDDRERQARRIVADDIDGPGGFIEARDDAVEVDQRRLTFHRQPKSGVVSMLRIAAAIAIAQDPGLSKVVVVRPRPIRNGRHRRDAERDVREYCRLKDALRPEEGNADSVELESLFQR